MDWILTCMNQLTQIALVISGHTFEPEKGLDTHLHKIQWSAFKVQKVEGGGSTKLYVCSVL